MFKARIAFLAILLTLLSSGAAYSQDPTPTVNVSPDAPKDKPVNATAEQARKLEEAIKPYVEMARKTYPEARERFLKGLPPKHSFFITTRLYDSSGRFEQVFIAVQEIKEGTIKGLIWSEIHLVEGYKAQQAYSFAESALIDWTITKPDGSEEGNFVGKFLDTYQPEAQPVATQSEASTWRQSPATPAIISRRIDDAAIKYQANAPIPRFVLYDIGYAKDAKENADLDGHAVLLLTVLVQAQSELPLKRVYVQVDGQQVELRQFKQVLSQQASSENLAAKTFGAYRMDALYLLPVHLRAKHSDLLVDFAQNRQGMKVTTFGKALPASVAAFSDKAPTGVNIQSALEAFVKREFPSFLP